MEHLMNCHGEWNFLLALLGGSLWVPAVFMELFKKENKNDAE